MSGNQATRNKAGANTPAGDSPRALWDDRLRGNPDESSVGCAGFGVHYNRWLYRLRAGIFSRLVKRLALWKAGTRVLDVGSGTGFYIEQWQRLGVRQLEGLDFSPAGVNVLRRRFPGVPFHHADIADGTPGLKPGGYDVISVFDVLFHIVDDDRYRAALNNLAHGLKPGGVLLFSENFVHRERPRVSDYHYSRTLEDIQHMCRDAGLVIEQRRPMFVLMNAPDDSSSAAMALWWRLVSAVARRGEWTGWLVGACLYPLEWMLTRLLREGPSTELAVCRRVSDSGVRTTP